MRTPKYNSGISMLLTILVGGLLLPISTVSTDEPQPLKATIIQIVAQKFCEEKTGYTIIQNLRVHVVNETKEKLIIERVTSGYGVYVARDVEKLSKGVYEYHTSMNWVVDVPVPDKPVTMSPGANFAILAPGESYDGFADFWAPVRRPDLPPMVGTLQPGSHVLQVQVVTWDYQSNPEEFRKSWERFGKLIYKPVKTEPFALNLPTDPKFDNCK
jgi:hypothetical protein